MKIRHILPADGLRAVYATPTYPYYRDILCNARALVVRYSEDDHPHDELIGLIESSTIIPADEPNGDMVFAFYYREGRYAQDELAELLSKVKQYGYQMAQAKEHEYGQDSSNQGFEGPDGG